MKQLKILLGLFFLTSYCFSQDKTINSIIDTLTLASGQLYYIYDLDVFSYYNLTDYETDLQKEVYKKTPEYSQQFTELKKIKMQMFKKQYYIIKEDAFYSEDEPVNYDIKNKGFYINMGSNVGRGTSSATPPKSVKIDENDVQSLTIYFKSLPTKMKQGYLGLEENLFIPIDEKKGLDIEKDRKNYEIYFIFTPSGKETVSFKYQDIMRGTILCKVNTLKADKVRMLVVYKKTGDILYDKTYNSSAPTNNVQKKK